MLPRLWARERRIETRQRLSLLAVSFCFGDFIPPEIAVVGRERELSCDFCHTVEFLRARLSEQLVLLLPVAIPLHGEL
jgi:hypothetical protein